LCNASTSGHSDAAQYWSLWAIFDVFAPQKTASFLSSGRSIDLRRNILPRSNAEGPAGSCHDARVQCIDIRQRRRRLSLRGHQRGCNLRGLHRFINNDR